MNNSSQAIAAAITVLIPGTIKVIERKGDRGSFNIGELTTPIGDFKVVDQWLDQFAPGSYKGDFRISRVEPRSRVWKDRVFVEVRATVVDYQLDELDADQGHDADEGNDARPTRQHRTNGQQSPRRPQAHGQQPSQPSKSDGPARPARSTPEPRRTDALATVDAGRAHHNSHVNSAPNEPGTNSRSDQLTSADDLTKIFGEELASKIAAGVEPIKLDPTIDRSKLREQRDWLNKHKYQLNLVQQLWMPPTR